MANIRYRLRPATANDRSQLLAIYASTRADELALTGWSEAQCQTFAAMQFEAQTKHYSQHWPMSLCQLILVDDGKGCSDGEQVAGRLWLGQRADSLHVLDISLLPRHRGQGLGGRCLRDLMARAATDGLTLSISVVIHNPARRLYERLGFDAQGAPLGLYQRMAWHPAKRREPMHQE